MPQHLHHFARRSSTNVLGARSTVLVPPMMNRGGHHGGRCNFSFLRAHFAWATLVPVCGARVEMLMAKRGGLRPVLPPGFRSGDAGTSHLGCTCISHSPVGRHGDAPALSELCDRHTVVCKSASTKGLQPGLLSRATFANKACCSQIAICSNTSPAKLQACL